jgi:long-chain acyl-CoA synthetase
LLLRADADAEEIVRRANAELADFQQIRHWHVWPEEDFPRTPTQKPRLVEIQRAVEAALGSRAASPPAVGTLAELIARVTGRPPAALRPEATLAADLNLSSIDRVALLSAIEDRYQVDLSEARFTEAVTVGEIEQMLRQPALPRSEFVLPRWAQRWPVTWLRGLVYYLLVWPATMLLARPAIRGREHLRGVRGPVLVISNHITRADIGFLLAALPPRIRHRLAVAMEGERLRDMRNPPPGRSGLRGLVDRLSYYLVVALFNVFPLPIRAGFRESFRYAGECADRGYSLLVFPEGRLTRDGKIGEFRTGIGILARNLRLPVVPMRIDGLFELKQKRQRFARPGTVRVTIGQPVVFEPDADPEQITRQLEAAVRSLGS